MSSIDVNAMDIRVSDPNKRVKIVEVDHPAGKIPPKTMIEAFAKTVSNYPDHKALMFKNSITGDWDSMTYTEYKKHIDKMAKVFIKLGLERHGTVAVLSFNCKEWFIAELAAMHAG